MSMRENLLITGAAGSLVLLGVFGCEAIKTVSQDGITTTTLTPPKSPLVLSLTSPTMDAENLIDNLALMVVEEIKDELPKDEPGEFPWGTLAGAVAVALGVGNQTKRVKIENVPQKVFGSG